MNSGKTFPSKTVNAQWWETELRKKGSREKTGSTKKEEKQRWREKELAFISVTPFIRQPKTHNELEQRRKGGRDGEVGVEGLMKPAADEDSL